MIEDKEEDIKEEVINKLISDIAAIIGTSDANKFEKVYALHNVSCNVFEGTVEDGLYHWYSFLNESLDECISDHEDKHNNLK